jgi:DNA-binding winged helix-turn-helix (wHTH) protein
MARESRLVAFGPFEADLSTGELRRDGQRVHLQQQPFLVLSALLDRPGELVSQQELRRRLWTDGTHVSFERGLASALRKLREALGDNAKTPVYVETLQRRGYRFIAPVSIPSRSQEPTAVGAARTGPAPFTGSKVRWAAAVFMALVIGAQGRFPAGADARLSAAESLSAYACLLKSRGESSKALEVIRQAQMLAPRSAKITAEVGFYLHAAGYYEAEFPALHRAAELDPSSPDVWLHMGLAYARREDFPRAVESLERARRLAGESEVVDRWLTWARQRL